jgi:hypothetical protein
VGNKTLWGSAIASPSLDFGEVRTKFVTRALAIVRSFVKGFSLTARTISEVPVNTRRAVSQEGVVRGRNRSLYIVVRPEPIPRVEADERPLLQKTSFPAAAFGRRRIMCLLSPPRYHQRSFGGGPL